MGGCDFTAAIVVEEWRYVEMNNHQLQENSCK